MTIITLITALLIAGIAGYYSIIGLTAIFSASFWPIVIMASALECGKLVTASWLYRNWKEVPLLLKTYLTTAVLILMCITSMGIFGFLSKAHLEQTISMGGNNQLRIESLERRIQTETNRIKDAELVISQLDIVVQTLIDNERIRGNDGAIAVRERQIDERAELNVEINSAISQIEEYQEELLPLKQQTIALEVEVGPLKYIAELIYGDEAADHLDQAVRWVIIMLIVVFDPLAVLLLIAANISLERKKYREMHDEDGNLKINPNNVFIAGELYEQQSGKY